MAPETLNRFCKDSWIVVRDGDKIYYISRHCCKEELDLYFAIARWQLDQVDKRLRKIGSETADDKELKFIRLYLLKKKEHLLQQFQKSGESQTFSSSENETLQKCLICGVARNRKVWREIKHFVYSYCSRNSWEDRLSECFHVLVEKNLSYLFSFNLKKIEHRDNENVMRQLSGYINRCLYARDILKECIFKTIVEEIPYDFDVIISSEQGDKILKYIFNLFEKARHEITIYAFIHEALAGRKRKSALARQHKKRLSDYIRKQLEKDEHPILEPFHAAMIADYIEESLSEGEITL